MYHTYRLADLRLAEPGGKAHHGLVHIVRCPIQLEEEFFALREAAHLDERAYGPPNASDDAIGTRADMRQIPVNEEVLPAGGGLEEDTQIL